MKTWMKKLTAVMTALIICIGITACGGESDDTKGGKETYKAALEPTFPPFDTTDEEGNLTGFDVDLLNAIGEDQGFKVEWSNLGFDGLIPGLQTGSIDIAIAGINITEEREKEIDFSDPYYYTGIGIVVSDSNTTIKSVEDLTADMKVGAQIATTGSELAQQYKSEGKIKEAKVFDKTTDAIMELKNGGVDALILDEPVAIEYMKQQPGVIKTVGESIVKFPCGAAVKEGNKELKAKIDKGLKNLKANGKYDELVEKWGLSLSNGI